MDEAVRVPQRYVEFFEAQAVTGVLDQTEADDTLSAAGTVTGAGTGGFLEYGLNLSRSMLMKL